MNILNVIVAVLVSLTVSGSAQAMSKARGTDPAVVTAVDLNRYSGLWHEVAHAPTYFQRKCIRSTAEYSVLSERAISVYNICYKANGKTSDISGTAVIANASEPAKLRVRFNIFAKGDYWITDLDENYQWAVVSAKAKKSLFILARTVPMDKQLLDKIIAKLKADGFDTDRLIFDQYP